VLTISELTMCIEALTALDLEFGERSSAASWSPASVRRVNVPAVRRRGTGERTLRFPAGAVPMTDYLARPPRC